MLVRVLLVQLLIVLFDASVCGVAMCVQASGALSVAVYIALKSCIPHSWAPVVRDSSHRPASARPHPPHVQREVRQLQLRLGQLQSSSQASLPGQQEAGTAQQAQQGGNSVDGTGAAAGSAPSAATAAEPSSSQTPLDMRQLAFPLRPIGVLRSCFSRRNGTPRQPLLVPAARAQLTLRPEMSGAYFEGLQEYSHW